ncbi:M56 family metallopeptidase [uncultured Psychroserpens sp.]|uniref:M56 family metallopeptidase n=1 Tax=uncultured Psychroserpens sp. TaxID=255436 RepID=UPI00261CCF9D|nr:M56 family metallopeptidase [uncultured Psychroserpens sp.]
MDHLLKASAIIFIFYVCYKLFLQRDTFFQSNRWFLLSGLILASCIQLIVIPIYIEYTPVETTSFAAVTNVIVPLAEQRETFDIQQLLFWIYMSGVIFLLGKFCIDFLSLRKILKTGTLTYHGSYKLIETNVQVTPFSFFNNIVYNPKQFDEKELQHIINHEKVHSKQLHSLDTIISQFACVFLWFNPIIWLYKNALQQNLEFIADQKAQYVSNCEKTYQTVLLKTSLQNYQLAITNNFYTSLIKKRIVMLHKSKSNKANLFKYLLVLPLLALFLMSFNTKNIYVEKEVPFESTNNIINPISAEDHNLYHEALEIEVKEPEVALLNTNRNQIKSAKQNISTAKATLKSQTKNNVIGHTTTIKPLSFEHNTDFVITKDFTDADLDNLKDELKKHGVTAKFKGIKRNNKGEITAIKVDIKSGGSSSNYQTNSDAGIKPINISFSEDGKNISIGNTHSNYHTSTAYVYKTKNGKHKLHKTGKSSNVYVIGERNGTKSKVIVNGKKIKTLGKTRAFEIISDDDGENEEEVELIIQTIDDRENDEEIEIIIEEEEEIEENYDVEVIKGKVLVSRGNKRGKVHTIGRDKSIVISGSTGKNPLFILDGKEISPDKAHDLDPDDIEKIEVLKGESATKKYGEKAKDGVIIIVTK